MYLFFAVFFVKCLQGVMSNCSDLNMYQVVLRAATLSITMLV